MTEIKTPSYSAKEKASIGLVALTAVGLSVAGVVVAERLSDSPLHSPQHIDISHTPDIQDHPQDTTPAS